MTSTFIRTLALVALALSLLAVPVAAQDAANGSVSDRHVEIDATASITDWTYDDGAFTVTVEATRATSVYILAPIGSTGEDQANFEPREIGLEAGDDRTVTVEADGDLMILTDSFLDTGAYATLDKGTDALVGPPWSHTDVWLVGGLGGLSLSALAFVRVVRRVRGTSKEPVRVG